MSAKLRPAVADRVLVDWAVKNGQRLRVLRVQWKHQPFIDIRRWFTTEGGQFKPTHKGIRFHSELVGPLAEVLSRMSEGDDA